MPRTGPAASIELRECNRVRTYDVEGSWSHLQYRKPHCGRPQVGRVGRRGIRSRSAKC